MAATVGVLLGTGMGVEVGVCSGAGVGVSVGTAEGLGVLVGVGVTVGEGAMRDINGQVQLRVIAVASAIARMDVLLAQGRAALASRCRLSLESFLVPLNDSDSPFDGLDRRRIRPLQLPSGDERDLRELAYLATVLHLHVQFL